MKSLTATKVSFSDLISQAFSSVHGEILELLKEALSSSLELLRDRVVGSRRYKRGSRYKRWGYTVRKWIQTPIGLLQDVAIPRVRSRECEIRIFVERFCRRSREIEEILLEGYVWGLSSRRLSVLMKRLFRDSLSHSGICQLKERVRERVQLYRDQAIREELTALVLDGIYVKYRRLGKRVVLFALGITQSGKVLFLDWMPTHSESGRSYRCFLRQLLERGLKKPDMIVSDEVRGIAEAIGTVWRDDPPLHQLCLWHVSMSLTEHLVNRRYGHIRHFNRDYWEIFSGINEEEGRGRFQLFVERWMKLEPKAVTVLYSKKGKLFHFYRYPEDWRHRLRTTNVAEGFFRHLRTFMRRYPGWTDENQLNLTVGIYLLGMKSFHHNRDKIYHQGMPCSILNLNFNRIY